MLRNGIGFDKFDSISAFYSKNFCSCHSYQGPKHVRVNSINPGPVETDFLRSRGVSKEARDRFYRTVTQDSLMGRIGSPTDISKLALHLASDDAANITGSIVVSDSGWLINPTAYRFKPDMYTEDDGKEKW